MQKFVGLDPRTRFARWGLLSIALGLTLGATLPSAADLAARAVAMQHDNLPWYASRLLGILAYLAIAGSVGYGLLLSTGVLDRYAHRPITFTLHQDLSSAGLGLAMIHGSLLALDRTVPFSVPELLVPFASPFRPVWVGLGQVGLYLTVVVIASFHVRRRIGQRTWRLLHYVTFLAFAGTTGHGVMSGTDTATPWATWLYIGAVVIVLALTGYRVVLAVRKRQGGRPAIRASSPVAGPRPIELRTMERADSEVA